MYINLRRKRDMYTNIKHNPNNLNLEDQVFLSWDNDETMIKKKGQKTLILKSPMATQTQVASRTSDISHKDHSPKREPQSKYENELKIINRYYKYIFSFIFTRYESCC